MKDITTPMFVAAGMTAMGCHRLMRAVIDIEDLAARCSGMALTADDEQWLCDMRALCLAGEKVRRHSDRMRSWSDEQRGLRTKGGE